MPVLALASMLVTLSHQPAVALVGGGDRLGALVLLLALGAQPSDATKTPAASAEQPKAALPEGDLPERVAQSLNAAKGSPAAGAMAMDEGATTVSLPPDASARSATAAARRTPSP